MRIDFTDRSWLPRGRRPLCWLAVLITIACVTSLTAATTVDAEYALQFDGTQQVDGTNSNLPQGNAARTMEAWIKPSETHNGTIFNYGKFATNTRAGILYIGGKLYFVGENSDVQGNIVLPVGKWTHVAASYDGSYMTLYVNGVVDVTAALPRGAHNTTGYNWRIGNGSDINYLREPFKGTIDEVRVWDYARTQAEIKSAMRRNLAADESGLVAYYQLNDGPDSTTTADSSSSESDGELAGTSSLPSWVDGYFDPNGGYGPNNRPVYLVLSLAKEFDTPDVDTNCDGICDSDAPSGSRTFIINLGTFVAGEEIPDTRFELETALGEIELPEGLTLADLDGYAITILGAFDTFSPNSIHLASPDEGDVPVKVQEAFFLASPFLTEELELQFPTTVEIARFIFDAATGLNPELLNDLDGEGPEEALTVQQILDHVFLTEATLDAPEDAAFAEAEGDLFPHPDGDFSPLFNFDLKIDENGEVEVAVVVDIKVDIKPGSDENPINLGAKGVLPVAILATTGLIEDIDDVDAEAINIGGVAPVKYTTEDVNNDGLDDLIFHFRIQELVEAELLHAGTDELTIVAALAADGAVVRGSDNVRIVPSKGKKK